ncbi:MAG: DUF6067 family protein [Phycisphaerae bacterium]|nr:DUF6067 family protein [Phycisphaerae bacterium]
MMRMHNKTGAAAFLVALLLCSTVFGVQQNQLNPGEETKLHVPKMKAPTFDGKITPEEWGNAAALSGPADVGHNQADSRPAMVYLGWDEKNLYMAVRVWMPKGYKPRIKGGRAQGFADCFDDGMEMVVRPMGKNVSDENGRTDFKFNISCLGFGGTYTRIVVGQYMSNWGPNFKTAVRNTADGTAPLGGRWFEMEVAFDLEDFELIKDNQAGDQWRVMFGFNHLPNAWMQQRIPCVGGFFTGDGKTLLTLVEKAPVARLEMLGIPNVASDGTAALKIEADNLGKGKDGVEVTVDVAGKIKKTQTLNVAAGKTATFELNEKLPADVKQGYLTVSVKHGDSTLLFYKSLFKVGQYNHRLKASPPADPNKFPFAGKFSPVRKLLQISGDSYNLPDPEAIKAMEYKVVNKASGQVIEEGLLDTPHAYYFGKVFELPEIKPGEYEVTASFLKKDGTRFGPRKASFKKVDEAKAYAEWWGKDTGKSERVVKPYVAIKEEGDAFTCLDRSYDFNALGLPSAVTSRKGKVLAAPARLVVVVDGKETVVDVAATPTIASHKGWRVRFKGEAKGAGLKFSTEGFMAQDGMVFVDFTYGPEGRKPAKIDALRLEFPVANDVAECIASVGQGNNFAAVTTTVLPTDKQGPLWSVFDTGKAGAKMQVGSFYPHVWLGNEKRGLQWWADSDKGWIPHDDVPAHEVYRKGDAVVLRNNIVGKPAEVKAPRTLRFTWTATPFKRLPKGWRNFTATEDGTFVTPFRGCRINPKTMKKYTTSTISWINPESEDPSQWSKLWHENRTVGAPIEKVVDGKIVLEYLCAPPSKTIFPNLPYDLHKARNGVSLNHQSYQVIGWGRKSQDKELFAYFGDEWYPGGHDTWNKSYVDYGVWLMHRSFAEGGVINTYWDLAFPHIYGNPLSGLAYQLPDGRWQPGYNTLNLREYYRRLWAVQDMNDLNPGAVGTHSTTAYIFPALPWLDAVLDGERDFNLDASDRDWIDYHPKERMRAISVPHNWGVGICWMGNFHSKDSAKLFEQKIRQVEYVWMHDSWINPYLTPAYHLLFMPQPILDWGMNGESVSYEPYWRKTYADSGDENVLVSVWRIPDEAAGRILVGVFNYDRENRKDVKVKIDLDKLGFSGKQLVMNDLSLKYTQGKLAEAKSRKQKKRIAELERVLAGLGEGANFDPKTGVLTIKNLGAHRGRFVGVGAVDGEVLATIKTQMPQWLGKELPDKARDYGIAHWRTRHIPEGTTMAATTKNKAVKLGMWKRDDRIVLSVYNSSDQKTDAEISLNMLYLNLSKRLLWQEFVRAQMLHGEGNVKFDYYSNKVVVKGLAPKSGALVGIRRY